MAAALNDFPVLCYVDLETTGARTASDRITEIALLRTEQGKEVARWSSLVDPGVPIPDQIVQITGINDALVQGAPALGDLMPEMVELIEGAALVAHNAAFDAGFLRHAFQRRGMAFDLPVLCTLKLSRALYPDYKRHGLDALIERFNLPCSARHRAMGDTELLPLFVQQCINDHGWEAVQHQWRVQQKRASLPPHLDKAILDNLPRGPGVYLFYGENDVLLYVGKSVNIRARVLSHFSDAKRSDKELRLSQSVRDIRWESCAGELSALLREAVLVKACSPVFNRQLRRHRHLFSWHWRFGAAAPELVDLADPQSDSGLKDLYGLFRSKKAAHKALRTAAREHDLCLKALQLEAGKGGCFAYQLKRCRGVCVGDEQPAQHGLRVAQAMAPLKVIEWPYSHPVGVLEENPEAGLRQVLVLDQWRVVGAVTPGDELPLDQRQPEPLDLDTYKILQRYLARGKTQVIPLKPA